MRRINFLTPQSEPNSVALHLPLRLYRKQLRDSGFDVIMFSDNTPKLYECDELFIDSKLFRYWWKDNHTDAFSFLDKAGEKVTRVNWLDTTDSTGTTQFEVLPHVDRYFKAQLLKDRELYKNAFYCNRIFADYYHNNFDISDEDEAPPSVVASDLSKLRIFWNSSMGDWGRRASIYKKLRGMFGIALRRSSKFTSHTRDRSREITCRMGRTYGKRATVGFQRVRIGDMLEKISGVDLSPIPRRKYFSELENSKVGVSPFGWGEIAYRDYEMMLAGCALVKPDMSHIQTWPDLYIPQKTYLPLKWDFSDFDKRIDEARTGWRELSEAASENYRKYIEGESAVELFLAKFREIAED